MEVLSRLIGKLESSSKLHGIKIARSAPPISHLLFADDLFLFCRTKYQEVEALKQALNLFKNWSGLRINAGKLGFIFSRNSDHIQKQRCKEIMECDTLGPRATYLGNPSFLSCQKAKDFEFLKQGVIARLESWQSQLLPKAGKGVLIKSVVQVVPAYAMATFKMPQSFCDTLDGLVRRFWWTRGLQKRKFLALGAWDNFCCPKQCGGLDFRRFRDINASILANLTWDLFSKKNKLWVDILSSKYIKEDIWNLIAPKNCSWGFRSILSCKDIILKGHEILSESGRTLGSPPSLLSDQHQVMTWLLIIA